MSTAKSPSSQNPSPVDVRLDGQTAIVTGTSAGGLGFEAAKELAAHGLARLILAVRNVASRSAEAARGKSRSKIWELDYESFESMTAFAARARSELDRLDIVILSAGVKNLEFVRAKTGHESSVQVNHLGTAYLSLLLLPILRSTATHTSRPARLTIVASEVHFWTPFSERHAPSILQRLDEESSFKPGEMERYNTSKLLNVLWTRELSSRVAEERNGSSGPAAVTINAVNPGFCASALHRSHAMPGQALINRLLAWTPGQGGHCLADAGCRHGDQQGAYISEQEVKAFVTSMEGERAQKRLWDETIALFQGVDSLFDLANLLEA
ncbi:short-chain dehydrogenase/reductase SDR [Apiospora hydei]|uniref:Short-chain dehydrogenase/reductase SDR n=1 Tax=Apiospora hydei TaxID=1337664 RepID=A0ABR1W9W1_9PEZI